MKKLTKTVFAMAVLAAPLFFMACEEETTLAPSVNDVSSSEQSRETDDMLD